MQELSAHSQAVWERAPAACPGGVRVPLPSQLGPLCSEAGMLLGEAPRPGEDAMERGQQTQMG